MTEVFLNGTRGILHKASSNTQAVERISLYSTALLGKLHTVFEMPVQSSPSAVGLAGICCGHQRALICGRACITHKQDSKLSQHVAFK